MSNSELLSLRTQILSDIVPLVLESTGDTADRFSLLLRIIQAGNASGDIYRRAYESAQKIEDVNDRLEALLSLLDEIDFDANQSTQTVQESSKPPLAQQPQPSSNNTNENTSAGQVA